MTYDPTTQLHPEDSYFAQPGDAPQDLTTPVRPEFSTVDAATIRAQLRSAPKDPSDKHFRISMLKSMIRFVGYMALPINLWVAALLLIAAEMLGVLEEL